MEMIINSLIFKLYINLNVWTKTS